MAYQTPGVFIEEINRFPPSVAQVETAIPAFIGYTEKAENEKGESLSLIPTRITSLLEYEQFFGGAHKPLLEVVLGDEDQIASVGFKKSNKPDILRMYYALQLFFANGGGPCYVVSININYPYPATGTSTGNIASTYKGTTYGSRMTENSGNGALDKIKKIDEVTLLVFPDAAFMSEAQYTNIVQKSLAHCGNLGDRFAILDLKLNVGNLTPKEFFRNNSGTNQLKYGAAYFPWLNTTLPISFDENSVIFTQSNSNESPSFNAKSWAVVEVDSNFDDRFTDAMKNEIKTGIGNLVLEMPPSPAIAGIYASVDNARGVWKAPANVSLNAVSGPSEIISDQEQEDYNVTTTGKSINVIRSFTGKGTLVWGARTLAGNDNEWRYVSVRRFFNMVEESVKKATEQFVFEPNDANTWVKLKAMTENFLLLQWRAGALAGAKPEDAFFVKVGLGETMSAQDILEGRLIVEIGMAAVRPAEFIILRFMHKLQES